MVIWRPRRANTQTRCPFNYRRLECKSRKSRNTWSNRQIWSWNTEWSRPKGNRVLQREHTGHGKHPLPTAQEKTLHMTLPDDQYRNQIHYIFCSKKCRNSTQSVKTRPGTDCYSDHELLIVKFILKLKKLKETTRSFNHDLNQIP